MGRWQTHQVDANAPALERAAKKLGLQIEKCGRPCDWIVLGFGLCVLAEVKTATGKLEPTQRRVAQKAGPAFYVLREVADVIALHNDLRDMAEYLALSGWPTEEIAAMRLRKAGRTVNWL